MASERLYCVRCEGQMPVRLRPRFEGFEKVGEEKVCAFCGAVFAPDSARGPAEPAAAASAPASLFEGWTRPAAPNPFGDDFGGAPKPANPFGESPPAPKPGLFFVEETGSLKICKNCKSYVIHPYTQKCMLDQHEVTATDSCAQFSRKKEKP